MTPDPIVCLISSWREGTLIQGAIHSVISIPGVSKVLVYDGPTRKDAEVIGEATYPGAYLGYSNLERVSGFWPDGEAAKRTKMLNDARKKLSGQFWILTLDADEILVWGEYLSDWLGQLKPSEGEKVVPIKRTESAWGEGGFVSDIAPSRLIHSSLVEAYLVSCWRILTPDNMVFEASHYRAEKQPCYGEPHIHHRHYLRRPERAGVREHEQEEAAFVESMRELGGLIPSPENIEEIISDENHRPE